MVFERVFREIVPVVHSDNQLCNASFMGFPLFPMPLSFLLHCLLAIASQTNDCHPSPCLSSA